MAKYIVDSGDYAHSALLASVENTDFKIHQFIRDRSRAGKDNYDLILK